MCTKRYRIAALCALGAGAAHAGVIVQSGVAPMQSTDWTQTVMIDQFDAQGGLRSLVDVSWEITGAVSGGVEIESLDPTPTTISVHLGSHLSMTGPGGLLGSVDPVATAVFHAAGFDGAIDFGGASGVTLSGLGATVTTGGPVADPAPFIGGGVVPLTFAAHGVGSASGSGNVITGFTTDASISYRIVYSYLEVPTPGALALMGVAGLASCRRKR